MIDDLDADVQEEETSQESTPSGGLGLGLNALFDEEESVDVPTPSVSEIEEKVAAAPEDQRPRNMVGVEQLYPGRFQPRQQFHEESINELAESIKQYGVLQPLLVRRDPSRPDEYEIIAGERRWRASQKAQLHEVPVVFMDIDELEAFKIALIENLQREDLDPMDEAEGYQRLVDDYGLTQEQLSKDMGRSRPHIANMMRLLSLPVRVQAYVSDGDLTMGHARSLVGSDHAEELAEQIVKKGLSVRQTEKLVKAEKSGGASPKKSKAPAPAAPVNKDADTRALEDDISNALGMNVSIDSSDGRTGTLSVEFGSLDQLDELLHRLAHFPGSRLSG